MLKILYSSNLVWSNICRTAWMQVYNKSCFSSLVLSFTMINTPNLMSYITWFTDDVVRFLYGNLFFPGILSLSYLRTSKTKKKQENDQKIYMVCWTIETEFYINWAVHNYPDLMCKNLIFNFFSTFGRKYTCIVGESWNKPLLYCATFSYKLSFYFPR